MTAPAAIRREAHRKAASRANSPKARLMELERDLRDAGANAKANSLRAIIGRLEDWQRP